MRLLIIALAFTLAIPSLAQDTKEKKKPNKLGFAAVVKAKCDLTEAQQAKIKEISKATTAERMSIMKLAKIDEALSKKRKVAFDALHREKPKLDNDKIFEKANKAAGLNEEQVAAQAKLRVVYKKQRIQSLAALTDEQRSKMPEWTQKEYAEAEAAKAKVKVK